MTHPFFSAANMQTLFKTIEGAVFTQTQSKINFVGDEKFLTELSLVAEEYPNLLITSDTNEGLQKLNRILVHRALRDLIEDDLAGQYYEGNKLFKQTTRTGRSENRRHGEDIVDRQNASVILGGQIYKKRNEKFQNEQKDLENSYMNHFTNAMFTRSQVNADTIEPLREL